MEKVNSTRNSIPSLKENLPVVSEETEEEASNLLESNKNNNTEKSDVNYENKGENSLENERKPNLNLNLNSNLMMSKDKSKELKKFKIFQMNEEFNNKFEK